MQNQMLNPPNVMQVISDLDIGGAQEVVRTLVEYLAAGGNQPVVCTFRDGPLRQDIEQLGIKVEVLPQRRYSVVALPLFIADMIHICKSLAELIEKHKIDVLQTHLLRSLDFLVLPLLYTTNLRVVLWTFHNASFELTADRLPGHKWLLTPKKYSHRFLYRWGSHLGGDFIAVSDKVAKAMLRTIGPIQDKVTVICNGVDVKRYQKPGDRIKVRSQLGLQAKTRLVAIAATLKEQKGHRYLIEAMTSIVPRYPELHVLFIGDGDLRGELQAQVKRLGMGDRIHFLGNRSDVPELLAASDFFVLPSLWEGLPMALLEAMATGLPIVATEVSGTVQVMIPNETGILVPPGDAQHLAEAIEHIISDATLAQAMGAAARRRVKAEFSAQKQADEHLALYRRLLSRTLSKNDQGRQ
ncbi:MAG: glycosyltransferase [Chloroflexota bacterium]|nr:glycosyltransferase [Chloroflexota bacterium]